MNCCYNEQQICLMNRLRQLWTQHVYWTRFFIISTVCGLNDSDAVTARLLQNPKDFADVFAPFYGRRDAQRFEKLFTEHLMIAAEFVNAAISQNSDRADKIRDEWYRNADAIACFLSKLNPYWNNAKWQEQLYSHLKMTEWEVAYRLQCDYEADIENFRNIENEALLMADYMFCGIVKQCFRH